MAEELEALMGGNTNSNTNGNTKKKTPPKNPKVVKTKMIEDTTTFQYNWDKLYHDWWCDSQKGMRKRLLQEYLKLRGGDCR